MKINSAFGISLIQLEMKITQSIYQNCSKLTEKENGKKEDEEKEETRTKGNNELDSK